MERIAIEKLIKWKDSPRRKPLVIEGARQVGKTWLVKEFAQRNYKQLAYVNFEDMKILQNLFVQDFDIPRVLTAIGAATHVTCTECRIVGGDVEVEGIHHCRWKYHIYRVQRCAHRTICHATTCLEV